MEIIETKVPFGIRYMSDWESYEIPKGHVIVDKGVTGCGYTEYCLRNNLNIILCSPRKLLLENKFEQHQGESNIFYLRNDVKDVSDKRSLEEKIKDHIINCQGGFNPFEKKDVLPVKLLVTYDSTKYVINVLKNMNLLESFYFVIDEFQSIFLDSFFKAEVEFDFVNYLQVCPNVLYLSATPMLEKYLCKVDEFKDLPFFKLNWEDTGITEEVIVKRKFARSLVGECRNIIQKYKSGKFDMKIVKTGDQVNIIKSTEAVFYLNSIGDITQIIKKENLKPSEVNIVCSDTEDNKKKIAKLSRDMGYKTGAKDYNGFKVGRIPLRGETNKMFTFCSKTAYIGSDFYSTCASSYVFADPNIDCLALDISLDLPQIVGRQRDRENPFKNEIVVIYRTIRKDMMISREEFDEKQRLRLIETNNVLTGFNKLSDGEKLTYLRKLQDSIKVSKYEKDFVSISKKTGLPVYNTFIELANERAWDVSQKDYQDKISVTKALEEVSTSLGEYKDEIEKLVSDFLDKEFYSTGIFKLKMRYYCDFMDKYKPLYNQELEDLVYYKIKDDRFRRFYNFYGTSGCSARRYEESPLVEDLIVFSRESEIGSVIRKQFKVGEAYTLKHIKFVLSNIYRDLGISKTAKATDLKGYFKVTEINISDPATKKRERGYRIQGFLF